MSSFNVKNDLSWRDILIRSALIIGTAVIIVWLMPRSTYMNFKIERGKPWAHTDLKAPFDFPIYKDYETLDAETEAARAKVKSIFVFNYRYIKVNI